VIKSKRVRWMRYVACIKMLRNLWTVLDRKPEGKKPFGGPGHR